jgi:hypothetical protein
MKRVTFIWRNSQLVRAAPRRRTWVHEVAQWARAITQSLSLIRKTYRKIDPAAGHGLGGTGAVFSWSRRRVAKKTFRNDGRITGLKASGFNGRDVKPANGMVGGLLPRFAVQEGTPHSINRWLNVNGPGRHARRVVKIAGRLPVAAEWGVEPACSRVGPRGGHRACGFRSWRDERSGPTEAERARLPGRRDGRHPPSSL